MVASPEGLSARKLRELREGFRLEDLLGSWVTELLQVQPFVDADDVCVRYVADFLLGMQGDCHLRNLEGRRADVLLGVVA